nr:ral GTPase-activating protein subunit beta-like [Nerophis lumbriciformis]
MDQSARGGRGQGSSLACFPANVARDVTVSVVTALGDGGSLPRTSAQLKWTMEVLRFGLSLPMDCDTLSACLDVYAHWLTVPVSPPDSIPPPVVKEPDLYVQKILRHLSVLFLPRPDRRSPAYSSVCQRVLSAVRTLVREGARMAGDTWETLLDFLLCVNQATLATPDSAPASLPSVEVLFQVSLASCSHCRPTPSWWLSWKQMMTTWRFQPAVLDQWTRIVSALTSRLLHLSLGPAFPRFEVPDEDAALIPEDMDRRLTLHIWFRFLHLLGNPADLKRPPQDGLPPPALGDVFLTAMSTVSRLVDAFLGVSLNCREGGEDMFINKGFSARIHFRDRLPSLGVAVTRSPFKDRLPTYGVSRPRSGSAPPTPGNLLSVPGKSQKTSLSETAGKPRAVSPQTSPSLQPWRSSSGLPVFSWALYPSPRGSPSPLRGSVDSLLHLFGFCLFDAALVDKNSALDERREEGRAEACGTLCRIFCSKKSSEDILPEYLSRFYAVLLQSLRAGEDMSLPVVSSVVLHSSSLFCRDLPGVNLLLPSFVSILEKVLQERELFSFQSFVSPVDLRRASISVLMSLLPLPQQFGSLHLKPPLDADQLLAGSVWSLKPRLFALLIGYLRTETDSANTQMLLAAILTVIHDCAAMELALKTHHKGKAQQMRKHPNAEHERANDRPAVALWVEFMHLLTQHLSDRWTDDSAVCLSAVEVLGGLAKVDVRTALQEKKRAVASVCRYIEYQCGRPPPLHSRELHSIIVAAFHCLSVWLTRHPDILEDEKFLVELLEVVELGVSGSKSRQEEEVWCPGEKKMNPVSLRVKEAAEATFNCIMQVSGASPSLDKEASSGLSEITLKKFRYFSLDDSVILGILEPESEPDELRFFCLDSLTVLIRGPFSLRSWNFRHRLKPREGTTSPCSEYMTVYVDSFLQKALNLEDGGSGAQVHAGISHRSTGPENSPLIDDIKTVPLVRADLSIPDLWESLSEELKKCLDLLRGTLERQKQAEAESHLSVGDTTCMPPLPAAGVQTARLFLSHLGLMTPETLKEVSGGGVPAQLASLDASLSGFCQDLRSLDMLSSRSEESVLIFYVRARQKTAAEILRNTESGQSISRHFLDFLFGLGLPAATGREDTERDNHLVFKYADALADITFVVASSSTHADWLKSQKEAESSAMIVWLERPEDIEGFPICQLTNRQPPNCARDFHVLFIHGLKSGLFRIFSRGEGGAKLPLIPPLVNGTVVRRTILGPLVIETLLNSWRRRRGDSTPPPHVRRKLAIGDLIRRYRSRRSQPADFYCALFQRP